MYAAAGAGTLAGALRNEPPSRLAGLPWLVGGAARLHCAGRERPDALFLALGVIEVALGAVLALPRHARDQGGRASGTGT